MFDMLKRILAGLLQSKKKAYPKHVHMTKDGVLYTSPNELLKAEPVIDQIQQLDHVRNGKSKDRQTEPE